MADSIAGIKHKLCRLVGRHLVADCMQLLLSLNSMQLSLTAMSNDCMEFMHLRMPMQMPETTIDY